MACLGGTRDEPRIWWRYNADGDFVRVEGRICQNNPKRYNNPRTSRRGCANCPAFRGLRENGTVANGCGPGGTVIALSSSEHDRWQGWLMDVSLGDLDDLEAATRFELMMEREARQRPDGSWQVLPGIGERRLRQNGDPDAIDRHAASMREWRAAHPGADKREKRDRAADMRAYRARKKETALPVGTVFTTPSTQKESDEGAK